MKRNVPRLTAIAIMIVGFLLIFSISSGVQGEQDSGDAASIVAAGAGPGLNVEITDAVVDEGGFVTVTFKMDDGAGVPLSRDDVANMRFLFARLEVDEETGLSQYVSYITREVEGAEYVFNGETRQPALASAIQPTFEGGEGEYVELGPGQYSYTFAEPLGEDYNPDLTHTVGMGVYRDPRTIAENPTFSWVPSGGEPITRLVSTTETCNTCHYQLEFHGGNRQEFEYCNLCHTPQAVDPESGFSVDMKVMIHQIHAGEELPSVQEGGEYFIVGHRQSVHDYSHIVWSQDLRNCQTCHTGPDAARGFSVPSNAACGSCHDDVDATTATNHVGRPRTDEECVECHTTDMTFDEESIYGVHVIPRFSEQIAGLNFEIMAVENAVAGSSPTITFKLTTNAGDPIAPGDMNRLSIVVAGPTTDYTNMHIETIFRAAEDAPEPNVEDAGDGAYSYTMEYVLPEDATGTYAFGIEGRIEETIDDVEDPVRVPGFNVVSYVNVEGGEAMPRRQIVDQELCHVCHQDLAFHGTNRRAVEHCVLCHNPFANDLEEIPEDSTDLPTTIDFRFMIHQIHMGGDLNTPYTVYGHNSSFHDYSSVAFPGIITVCETCHLPGTYLLPLDAGTQPVTVFGEEGDVLSEILPETAVCMSCHDSVAAGGHAELQTTESGIETCSVCHAAGREANAHP